MLYTGVSEIEKHIQNLNVENLLDRNQAFQASTVRFADILADIFATHLVPVDRLPVLLIANSQNIQATSLSGTTVHSLLSTTTKQTTAMDFLYAEETVCWIHVGDSPSSTHLKCARIPNLKSFTEERIINISLSLHRECHNGRMMGWRGWRAVLGWSAFSHADNVTARFVGLNSVYMWQMLEVGG